MFRDISLDLIDFQIAFGDGLSRKWSSTPAWVLPTMFYLLAITLTDIRRTS